MQIAKEYLELGAETGLEADRDLVRQYEKNLKQLDETQNQLRQTSLRASKRFATLLAATAMAGFGAKQPEPPSKIDCPGKYKPQRPVTPAPNPLSARTHKKLAQGIARLLIQLAMLQGKTFARPQQSQYELQRELEYFDTLNLLYQDLAPVLTAALAQQAWVPQFREVLQKYGSLRQILQDCGCWSDVLVLATRT